ncbi:MAG: bifunctional hydroxymethylpyrimidine kinase/phosphomethylpyrimidine kinase [Bacteroidaceae bacterium]
MKRYITALSIAGSDPSAGAGIQADLKTFSALGVYGLTIPTVLTVQNTMGVSATYPLPPELITAQIDAVMCDIHPQVVKIGMTGNSLIIKAISKALQKYNPDFILLDPIMYSSSGHQLLSTDSIEILKEEILPLCSLVTPNLYEAEILASTCKITNQEDAQQVGNTILAFGCDAVLIKGGHLEGSPIDVLVQQGGNTNTYMGNRIETQNTHGTGCTLSSAIAAFIAQGMLLHNAVNAAKCYLTQALQAGAQIHLGAGCGPMNHFFSPKKLLIEEK